MADLNITIIIPDAYISRGLEAANGMAGKEIKLSVKAEDFGLDPLVFGPNWIYSYDPKDVAESNVEFAERTVKKLLMAFFRLYDLIDDQQRYRDEVNAITPPSQDVPDEMVE